LRRSEPEDGVVTRARALLVGLDGMTGDIVGRLLRDEPGCEVIAERPERAGLLDAIRRYRPSIVVVGLKQADVGPGWDDLFLSYPDLQVLAVTPEGRRACLFREPLEEGLVAALQRAVTE
jgi:chemotaxis response regulator CheB